MAATVEAARGFILGLLQEKGPLPEGVEVDRYRYLDTGHIDSLGLIKFAFRIEEAFDLRFSPQEIASEEFRTVGGLARLVAARAGQPS